MTDKNIVNANAGVLYAVPSMQKAVADETPSSSKEIRYGSLSTKNSRWRNCMSNANVNNISTESFKGAHADLKGEVFIKGLTQAAKYDKTCKAYITFVGTKYG